MGYEAVVFDNDGVITGLTERAVLRSAVREAFREVGVDDPADGHVDDLLVGVTVPRVREICAGYGVDPEAFWPARDRCASRAQCAEIRAGNKPIYDDVSALADLTVPAGIVSANQQATIEFVVEHYGLGDRFGTYYGREPTLDGLRRKKPDTYYVDRALADLGVESALFVGDSDGDLEAARRAGLDSAFVRRPHRADHEPAVEPTHEVADLHEVVTLVEG